MLNSATQVMVNDATGVLQDGIGDVKDAQRWGEGSVPGALLHGGVGGLASLAKDGDFAAGFVTSAGGEFVTGFVDRRTGDEVRTGKIIRKYGNPTLAALTSGGDVNQYSINQGISDSQLNNNYYGQHEANGSKKYKEYARENCQNLSPTECGDKYYEGAFTGVRMILDEVPFVGEGIAGYECWSGPGAGTCAGIFIGIIPFGKRGLDIVKEGAEQLRKRGEITTLYRGVSAEEYKDIMKTGKFRPNPGGSSFDGKQFGYNLDEVYELTNKFKETVGIVRVEIPTSVLDEVGDFTPVDRHILKEGSVTIQPKNLTKFNECITGICDALEP